MSSLPKRMLSHSKPWNLWKKERTQLLNKEWAGCTDNWCLPQDVQRISCPGQLPLCKQRTWPWWCAACFEKLVPCIDHFPSADSWRQTARRSACSGTGCEVAENWTQPALVCTDLNLRRFFFSCLRGAVERSVKAKSVSVILKVLCCCCCCCHHSGCLGCPATAVC